MDITSLVISFVAAFIILALVIRGEYGKVVLASLAIAAISYLGNFGMLWAALGWVAVLFFLIKFVRFSFGGALLFVIGHGIVAYGLAFSLAKFVF